MKKYLLTRLFKSIISIMIVVAIVVVMVYKMVPTTKAFEGDASFQKLKANSKTVYMYEKLDSLGYLDYLSLSEMCSLKSENSSECMTKDSDEYNRVIKELEGEGYTLEPLNKHGALQGQVIMYRYYSGIELIVDFYKKLVTIDHPNYIQDPNNPNMERGYYIEKSASGLPALKCRGCENQNQIYVNGTFPFIHSNIISFEFGESFPTHRGVSTLDVIGTGQGKLVQQETTFPTGKTLKSPIDLDTCKYKANPDRLDLRKFEGNYADCESRFDSPSMITTSYIFGICALILTYLIAIPFASAMARNKGKFIDNLGIVVINLLIAVPSLALIFFFKLVGTWVGLPDMFPYLGFKDIRSFIMPIFIMAVISLPYSMMWIRRYMVDQTTADYVKFAKAKGLSKREISKNHIFRNAIIPIVNGLPASVVLQISGAVITETVFAIPGMGKMLPDAIKAANNNMVITLTFIFTALSVFAIFAGDILMTIVDPRISLNEKEGE